MNKTLLLTINMKKLLIISFILINSINAGDDSNRGSIIRPYQSVYNTPVTTLIKAFNILILQSKIYKLFPSILTMNKELKTLGPYLRSFYRYLSTNKCTC